MSHSKFEDAILLLLKSGKSLGSDDIRRNIGHRVSRQHIHRVLVKLIDDGKVLTLGKGRWTKYMSTEAAVSIVEEASHKIRNTNLIDESAVYYDLKSRVPAFRLIKDNVDSILNYAFTEMLNNAIDHSGSKTIYTKILIDSTNIQFLVSDNGIGIFRNLKEQRNLPSIHDALLDLSKGKITTLPDRHSGEGIFYTSRLADSFIIESYGYKLMIDLAFNSLMYELILNNLDLIL